MSIAEKLTELNTIKTNLFTAISEKGVVIPEGSGLKDCPNLVTSIEQSGTILPANYAIIQDKVYRTITKNNMIWTAQNVEVTFDTLVIAAENSNEPRATYWVEDKNTNGLKGSQWGLYYNWPAVSYLIEHPELLNGFRIPSEADYQQLFSDDPVNNFKSVNSWNSNPGNDSENFTLFPSGFWEDYFGGNGAECYLRILDNRVFHLNRNDTNINFLNAGYAYTLYPIRLVKDL